MINLRCCWFALFEGFYAPGDTLDVMHGPTARLTEAEEV
jgi:hypothetical protein